MSRKDEQLVWDAIKRHSLRRKIKLWRVENLHGDGMSDVYGINRFGTSFWMELKSLDEWPRRDGTCPLKGIFEPGQLGFMRSINSWGGHAYVVVRVGLHDWRFVRAVLGLPDPDELDAAALLERSVSDSLDDFLFMLEEMEGV